MKSIIVYLLFVWKIALAQLLGGNRRMNYLYVPEDDERPLVPRAINPFEQLAGKTFVLSYNTLKALQTQRISALIFETENKVTLQGCNIFSTNYSTQWPNIFNIYSDQNWVEDIQNIYECEMDRDIQIQQLLESATSYMWISDIKMLFQDENGEIIMAVQLIYKRQLPTSTNNTASTKQLNLSNKYFKFSSNDRIRYNLQNDFVIGFSQKNNQHSINFIACNFNKVNYSQTPTAAGGSITINPNHQDWQYTLKICQNNPDPLIRDLINKFHTYEWTGTNSINFKDQSGITVITLQLFY